MVRQITDFGKRRYVGDAASKIVHDRWHPDSEGCGLSDIVRRGDAVGFEPDTLDGALYEGYEYCEACFDKEEPEAPSWAAPDPGGGLRAGRDEPPSVPLVRNDGQGDYGAAKITVRVQEVRG
jgi:hypothetical protein